MRESSQEYSATGECIIFDTSAFLAGIQNIIMKPIYTTRLVINEILDEHSKSRLDISLETGRVIIKEIPTDFIEKTSNKAKALKITSKLSETDISIAALALMLRRECRPLVFTDDYTLQYLLKKMGIKFQPLRTKGIKTK